MTATPHTVVVSWRHLDWDGCWNVRDLGGLPAGEGLTRWRSLIRANYLGDLSAAGRRALWDYGVRTVVDLRAPEELIDRPPPFPGGRSGEPAFRLVPIDRRDPKAGTHFAAATTRFDIYRVLLDFYPQALAEALAVIADAPPGGVIFHCLGGTDRTGLVAAAVLRLAGVSDETIAADYALTLERRRAVYEQLVAEHGEANLGFWDRLNMTADQMLRTLEYVDERHGGMETYLRAGGLTDEQMARVRARLRPEP